MKALVASLFVMLALPGTAAANSTYSQSVLTTPSLVAFWRLGENYGDADNAYGQPMLDATGAFNGTYPKPVTTGVQGPVEGDPTTATIFGQWNGYGSVPYSAVLNPSTFTVEAWASAKQNQINMSVVSTQNRTDSSTGYNIGTTQDGATGKAMWHLGLGNGSGDLETGGTDIVPGAWTYLVATYDGTTARFYVNGVLINHGNEPYVPTPSYDTHIGLRGGNDNVEVFNGSLANVAIYNSALSASTIASHYAQAINSGSPPDVQIVGAPSGTMSTGSTSVAFQSGSVNPTFKCQLDGGSWYSCSSPAQLNVADGAHRFAVQAINRAGVASAQPAVAQWSVDTVAPQAVIQAGPAGLSSSSSATIFFGVAGAVSYECSLDYAPAQPCGSPFTATGLSDGPHTFGVQAIDALGNIQAGWTTRTWTVDTIPPVTYISKGPIVPSDPSTFRFSASKSDVTFRCRVDGRPWTSCQSPYTVTGVAPGTHVFTVDAVDSAGNSDPVGASYMWTANAKQQSAAGGAITALTFPGSVRPFPARKGLAARTGGPQLMWHVTRAAKLVVSVVRPQGRVVGRFTVHSGPGTGSTRVPFALWRKLRVGSYILAVKASFAGEGGGATYRLKFVVKR